MYDLETNEFFVSRDVKFFELEFPYLIPLTNSLPILPPLTQSDMEVFSDDEWEEEGVECARHSGQSDATYITSETDHHFATRATEEHVTSDSITNTMHEQPQGLNDTQDNLSNMGKGQRQKFVSSRLRDYVTHTIQKSPSSSSSTPSSSSGIV